MERPRDAQSYLDLQNVRRTTTPLDKLAARLRQHTVQALADEAINRMAGALRSPEPLVRTPSPSQIDLLCEALLTGDLEAGTAMISRLRAEGVSIKEIYTVYLAATARRMGEMWENDVISFIDVTIGVSRILAIMRGLREDLRSTQLCCTRSALFATVPDEQHTLGITMAADLFRREGWDIELVTGASHEEIIDRVGRTDALVIGLAAHGRQSLTALLKFILAIRTVNPAVHVVVCGALVDRAEDILTGAAGFATDVPSALLKMRELHDAASGTDARNCGWSFGTCRVDDQRGGALP